MIQSINLDEKNVEQFQDKTTNQLAELGGEDGAINRFKIECEAQKVEVVALKTEANVLEERLKALKERLDLVSLAPNERPKAEEARSGKPARDLNAGRASSDQRIVNALEERLNALKERLDLVSLAPNDRPKAEEARSGEPARDLNAGRDSSDQRIEEARNGSDFSAGKQVVEPSIHAPARGSGYQFVSNKPWIGGQISRSGARVFIAALIGAGATFAWQFHGDGAKEAVRIWISSLGSLSSVSATKSPLNIDVAAKQSGYTAAGKVSAQDAALAQPTPVPQVTSAPAAAATSPEHSGEQLTAKQEQMSDNIETLQALDSDLKQNASPPPLQNGTQLTPTPETRPITIEGWTLAFEVAVEPQVPKIVLLRPNITKIVVVSRDIRTVHVGNPDIADTITLSARKVSIVPKRDGTTSIDILGDHGDQIGRLIADVDTYTGTGASRVEVNNKAKLTSSTIFRCAPLCRYVDELTVKEPASLPRGHFQAGYDYNIPNIPNAPQPAPAGALIEPGG